MQIRGISYLTKMQEVSDKITPFFFVLKEKERNYDIRKYKKFLAKSMIGFQKQLKKKSDLKIGKKRQCDTFIVSTLRQSSTFVWFSSV